MPTAPDRRNQRAIEEYLRQAVRPVPITQWQVAPPENDILGPQQGTPTAAPTWYTERIEAMAPQRPLQPTAQPVDGMGVWYTMTNTGAFEQVGGPPTTTIPTEAIEDDDIDDIENFDRDGDEIVDERTFDDDEGDVR